MKVKPNVIAIIDGQAGSCGKGKVIGQYAKKEQTDIAISNNMPNAGHTYQEKGCKRVFRTFPVSSINPNVRLFLGGGTMINMDVLEEEYEQNKDILEGREIIAHPQIPLIEQRHIDQERKLITSGTTYSGCGACRAEYIMRCPQLKFFQGYKNIKVDPNYSETIYKALLDSRQVILEGAQGCDLDLLHSSHYPYVTSRSVSFSQMCNDAGISPDFLKEKIMVIRPYPIRISNQATIGTEIYTGPYGHSQEWTWPIINVAAFLEIPPEAITPEDLIAYQDLCQDQTEYTTVTKKVRRIFSLDAKLLRQNCQINQPTSIYLNFFQHLLSTYSGFHGVYDGYNNVYFNHYIREYLNWIEDITNAPITMLGTGPDVNHYIDCRPYHKLLKKELKKKNYL